MMCTFPVYTSETECQDCYKCLRQCPVKAIRVANGRATVMPEACIACGHCVEVCPAGAKQIRHDLERAVALLQRSERVVLSLAPSYPSVFPEVSPDALAGALLQLGFAAVSETALGAEQVNRTTAEILRERPGTVNLSTACPVAVRYICKYLPEFAPDLTPVVSPMLAHAKALQNVYDDKTAIVFAGPCIAKKLEADEHPELIAVALTFNELKEWLDAAGITPGDPAIEPAAFAPHKAADGALYPIAGGMGETLRPMLDGVETGLLHCSGLQRMEKALRGLQQCRTDGAIFVELLACQGGCLGGPCAAPEAALRGEIDIRARHVNSSPAAETGLAPRCPAEVRPGVVGAQFTETQLTEALGRIGKVSPEDEINCSGCGYDTCRAFAVALLSGLAEPEMCVSNLRRKAQRKANALLRCIPSGVVIADAALNIVECNENFARMFGDLHLSYQARPGLGGVALARAVPFAEIFRRVLETGQEERRELLRTGENLINLTVFPIEQGSTVGAILQDVTVSAARREYITQKAREVIDRNLSTVQEIAFKLGEHMAETEILLRSIATDYNSGSEEQI